MLILTISLNEIRLHAFHGMHPEERVWGNEFVVNVLVRMPAANLITSIDQTVDYGAIHAVVCHRMNKPTPLLEEVAGLILQDILSSFSMLVWAQVRIQKMNPPLGGRVGSSEVCLEKSV